MVDMAAMALVAQRLVEANARTITLRRQNTTPAAGSEPWKGPATTIATGSGGRTLTVPMCFVPAGGSGLGKQFRELAGGLDVVAEQVGMIASLSAGAVNLKEFEGGTVLDDSRTWKIEKAHELRPSTTSLLWLLELKS